MTAIGDRLYIKRRGGLIAWACIPLGHAYGPVDEEGWRSCTRRGCTERLQADKRDPRKRS